MSATLARALVAGGCCWCCRQRAWPDGPRAPACAGDYIVAVINQELVTAGRGTSACVDAREPTRSARARACPDAELRQQVLDALIEERVHRHPCARQRRARRRRRPRPRRGNIAAQNQLTLAQLRERLRRTAWTTRAFAPTCATRCWSSACASARSTQRIRITDAEIDRLVEQQRAAAARPRCEY
jgi:peptidyl-prolyl cis-trans isomerase SurA